MSRKLTDGEIAEHELSHLLVAAMTMQKRYPHLYDKFHGEIEIQEAGGHAIIFCDDKAVDVNAPSDVLRLMSVGPVLLSGIENLRDILRAKTVPLEGTKMSGPDINSMLSKGGDYLSVADCEILCAAARIAHDLHWQDAVTAIVSAKSLTMPMPQWFSSKMLSKALESSGNDYMKLHSRYDGLPEWCVKSVERRYNDAMAMSPAL